MRQKMGQMQAQIQEFIANLNREFAAHTRLTEQEERHWLVPVVNARPPASKVGQAVPPANPGTRRNSR
jgi:hypothetical protein